MPAVVEGTGLTYFTSSRWSAEKSIAELEFALSTDGRYFNNADGSKDQQLRVGDTITNFYADLTTLMRDPLLMANLARFLVQKPDGTRYERYASVTHVLTRSTSLGDILWAHIVALVLGNSVKVIHLTPSADFKIATSGEDMPALTELPVFMIALIQVITATDVQVLQDTLGALYGEANINDPDLLTVFNVSRYANVQSTRRGTTTVIYPIKQVTPSSYSVASVPSSWQDFIQVDLPSYLKSKRYDTDLALFTAAKNALL